MCIYICVYMYMNTYIGSVTEMSSGSQEGSYLRRMDVCVTQLQA